MKQEVPEKSNIAWFKLAEFITRGEKERALSIYRLLSYSITDQALVAQLEGDILQAFNDERAIDSYQRAIDIYHHHRAYVNIIDLARQIISIFLDRERVSEVDDLITITIIPEAEKTKLREHAIIEILKREAHHLKPWAFKHLKVTLDKLSNSHEFSNRLTTFLGTIAALDNETHQYACTLLASGDNFHTADTKKVE
ncbi:MAG: hypothetical protein JW725_04420 [Candidatus Babeliaceae bacterium]|nr:hypothetical protein [Candidatus Babeliaceae bacterium]